MKKPTDYLKNSQVSLSLLIWLISLKRKLIERMNAADNEFRKQMRKMINTMKIVGHSISQCLALMTAKICINNYIR